MSSSSRTPGDAFTVLTISFRSHVGNLTSLDFGVKGYDQAVRDTMQQTGDDTYEATLRRTTGGVAHIEGKTWATLALVKAWHALRTTWRSSPTSW